MLSKIFGYFIPQDQFLLSSDFLFVPSAFSPPNNFNRYVTTLIICKMRLRVRSLKLRLTLNALNTLISIFN